jgi:hypothetical protein
MTLLVARSPLTEALKTMLNTAPQIVVSDPAVDRFDVGRAPDNPPRNKEGELIHGYGMIYPVVSPITWGSLQDPEDVLTAVYQITFAGRTPEHVQNLSDATHVALLNRGSNGVFSNAITVSGLVVVERRCAYRGGVTQGTGGIWELPDTYEVEAQSV